MEPPCKNKGRLNCLTKHRYPDQLTAQAAGISHSERHPELVLHVYCCPHCHGYHLTRQIGNRSVFQFD